MCVSCMCVSLSRLASEQKSGLCTVKSHTNSVSNSLQRAFLISQHPPPSSSLRECGIPLKIPGACVSKGMLKHGMKSLSYTTMLCSELSWWSSTSLVSTATPFLPKTSSSPLTHSAGELTDRYTERPRAVVSVYSPKTVQSPSGPDRTTLTLTSFANIM